MRGRIKSKTKAKYQKRIRDVVINGLGRSVTVYRQPIKNECPNCYYDKLTDTSTGTCSWTYSETLQKQADYEAANGQGLRYKYFVKGRCPVCAGRGYLEVHRRTTLEAKITWDPTTMGSGNATTYTAAGTEGSTLIELKTHPKYLNTFKNCLKVIVDGIECRLSKPPLVRGLGNQALLIVTVFTTEKPKVDSGELIKDYA
jgi:hypothetical protein